MFIRGRYGHGGRIGYEKEWRADRTKSGGGELIDQGTHLLDLSLGFLGSIKLEVLDENINLLSSPQDMADQATSKALQ